MSERMDLAAALGKAQEANLAAVARAWGLLAGWGQPSPGAEASPPDRRFQDPAWRENPAFALLRQSYLIAAQWMMDVADSWQTVAPAVHRRAAFWTRQLADALSPANFALTNPVVWQETIRTGGANLARGWANWLADVQAGRISQVPAGSFQVGRDLAITPGQVVYRNPLIELIQYAPATERVHTIPLLIIPPWVNKYYVMDLRPENSLFKHLIDGGFTLFTISWRNPDSTLRHLGWDDYVTLGPLAALRVVQAITGADRVNLAGYCLGGVLLATTLAYLAAVGDPTVHSATYFATHQDFSAAGEIGVFISEPEIAFLEWLMDASGGYLDGRNMAATFNLLRANDLIWPYVVSNYLLGQAPPAFDLLYWNSDGTRVPERVHSFLLRELFLANRLREPGGVTVCGVGLDLRRITMPIYAVAADADHIVPWKGMFQVHNLVSSPVRFVLAEGGHIAGIINPPAAGKRGYWTNDAAATHPDEWLAGATRQPGSWWGDWLAWLKPHAGRRIAPPPLGHDDYPPLAAAPGAYVLET